MFIQFNNIVCMGSCFLKLSCHEGTGLQPGWANLHKQVCLKFAVPACAPCSVVSVVSDALRPQGLQPARLLCPWDFPGNNTGVGCHFLLQGIFPTQALTQSLLHWQAEFLSQSYLGSSIFQLPSCSSGFYEFPFSSTEGLNVHVCW